MYTNLCNNFVKVPSTQTILWILPCLDFERVSQLQKEILVHKIENPDCPDFILMTSHPPSYTLGRASSLIEKETPYAFPSYEIERGGHLTFHHPEQVILYPLLKLKTPDVHAHLKRVLHWGQNALNTLGIHTDLDGQGSGLWLDECHKVASIGIAVKRWISYHGLAMNVSVDPIMWQGLPPNIYPCSLPEAIPTNLGDIDATLTRQIVEDALIAVLQNDVTLQPLKLIKTKDLEPNITLLLECFK